MNKEPILLIDGNQGIYIPKQFAEQVIVGNFICPNKRELLQEWGELGNPNNEFYWESWETVLNDCILLDKDGNRFTLHQDGDLWAIPEGCEVDELFQ